MEFEIKTLQQNLNKETSALKSTSAQLDAKNRKYASIEGVKSEKVKGLMQHRFNIHLKLCSSIVLIACLV